jgi:hypothetical protein
MYAADLLSLLLCAARESQDLRCDPSNNDNRIECQPQPE